MSILDLSNLPPAYTASIGRVLGAAEAQTWLNTAVELAAELCVLWGLSALQVLEGGAKSLCVLCATPDGARVVLKLPSSAALGHTEIDTLTLWATNPDTPRPLNIHPASGSFTMAYFEAADRQPAAGEALALGRALHVTVPEACILPELRANVGARVDRALSFADAGTRAWNADLRTAAGNLALLLRTQPLPVVLHGDFQRKNLVVTATGLAAIDPSACIGDPLFDDALLIAAGTFGVPEKVMLAASRPCDRTRLELWAWSLAVVESHPGRGLTLPGRQAFIDGCRRHPPHAS